MSSIGLRTIVCSQRIGSVEDMADLPNSLWISIWQNAAKVISDFSKHNMVWAGMFWKTTFVCSVRPSIALNVLEAIAYSVTKLVRAENSKLSSGSC